MTEKAKTTVRYTLATHSAERMTPSGKTVQLCGKIAEGRISADRAVEEIKRSYGFGKSGNG